MQILRHPLHRLLPQLRIVVARLLLRATATVRNLANLCRTCSNNCCTEALILRWAIASAGVCAVPEEDGDAVLYDVLGSCGVPCCHNKAAVSPPQA